MREKSGDDFVLGISGNERTVEVRNREVQESVKIEKQFLDLELLKKRSNSKTFPGWLISEIKQARDKSNFEMALLMQTIYKKYKQYELSEKIILNGWKGKSSLQIIEKPDSFEIITYQKEDQESKPKKVSKHISKAEVNEVLTIINELDKNEKIPTRSIGEFLYKEEWDRVFSNRFEHTNLNYILRLLDYYGIIKYRGGKSIVLKDIKEIQEVSSISKSEVAKN
jgi:hypothetical protein